MLGFMIFIIVATLCLLAIVIHEAVVNKSVPVGLCIMFVFWCSAVGYLMYLGTAVVEYNALGLLVLGFIVCVSMLAMRKGFTFM